MKPGPDADPVSSILFILLVTIRLPYAMLAATNLLLQYWYGRLNTGKEPYVLYSVSNIGSLLALVSYPVVIEPLLTLRIQSMVWSVCFACFTVTCGFVAWLSSRPGKTGIGPAGGDAFPDTEDPSSKNLAPKGNIKKASPKKRMKQTGLQDGFFEQISWIVLPMLSCMLLLAVTNQLCTDVASGPFLRVLPLSIYLLSVYPYTILSLHCCGRRTRRHIRVHGCAACFQELL
jgi:hypothetical protein